MSVDYGNVWLEQIGLIFESRKAHELEDENMRKRGWRG